jgi:DNA-directed RNA polymerase subunit E'
MDDEVSVSGREALIGKNSKRVLKVNDVVKARIVTVSYKGVSNVRIAMTMKQPGLGKLEWLEQKKKTGK